MNTAIDLSIVIGAYNMGRELPRTIYTLSRSNQRNAANINWDLIVVDNHSDTPVDEDELRQIAPEVRVTRPKSRSVSPSAALNEAVASSTGRLVGLWIDGARLATPNIVSEAVRAWKADSTKVVGTLAFHLGPDVQMRSVSAGYNRAVEDELLATVPWRSDGYRLFDIGVLAGSSLAGWFGCIAESNGVFLDRSLWNALGGLDERFQAPGGGFVNLDFWSRAVAASGSAAWMILGEGTFHQVHGGAATNGTQIDRNTMAAEYRSIAGTPFVPPAYSLQFVGGLSGQSYAAGIGNQLDKERMVHAVNGRHFHVGLDTKTLEKVQKATLGTRYKGLRLAKNPFDLALYLRLLEELRPASIIEIGSSEGGSAVWFRDQCIALGLPETHVVSMDIKPPAIESDGTVFEFGDGEAPDSTFPTEKILQCPHPWLVVDDGAHTYSTVSATLEYFDRLVVPGDFIVVEGGVVADLPGAQYRAYSDGPNRAVAEFLDRHGQRYKIAEEFCDFYGDNVTWAPNGWLRRTGPNIK